MKTKISLAIIATLFLSFNLPAQTGNTDYFAKGVIHIIPSSHQDIAWMDSPENCKIERDTMMIARPSSLWRKNPAYVFSVEQVLNLEEYLSLHPDQNRCWPG